MVTKFRLTKIYLDEAIYTHTYTHPQTLPNTENLMTAIFKLQRTVLNANCTLKTLRQRDVSFSKVCISKVPVLPPPLRHHLDIPLVLSVVFVALDNALIMSSESISIIIYVK